MPQKAPKLSQKVDECKPLTCGSTRTWWWKRLGRSRFRPTTPRQGLTLAHFTAQFEDLRGTSITFELNVSTFGTHPRVSWVYMGHYVSLS